MPDERYIDLNPRITRLYDAVLDRLIDILENGAPSGKPGDGTRSPAPAAYVSAAIKFLKDAGVFEASPGADDSLAALLDGFDELDGAED